MKICSEISLKDFEFWSGALDRVKYLSDADFDHLEFILEEMYDDEEGISDTQINDIFWFEEDWIAEVLGFSSFEELERHNNGEDEDEVEDEEE